MSSDKFAVKIENTIKTFQEPLKYVKTQKVTIYKAILLFFTLLFLWHTYENYWIIFFNHNIYPYLHISWNKISICLYTLIMSGIIYLLIQTYKNKYIISASQMSVSLIFIIIYSFYRLQSYHINGQILSYLWYLDLLVSTLSVFIILAITNIIKCLLPKTGNEANADFCLIPDRPITKAEDDILNYSAEIEKLTKKLETLNLERSWSIGITSVWGGGKTSFLNLLEESMRKHKDFIVVKFNPRNSKNAESIQEDFFSVICSALKPYNSCFSRMFKDYMKALQLFDKENIINTIFNLRKIADKNSEKIKLDTALKLLNKKVTIFIDDFDRLLAEEVIEVFKLIDDNASFPNLIFLTAYDKKYISTIINKTYCNKTTLFSDKFFNYEEVVPIRPYKNIYNYLKNILLKELNAENNFVEKYETILSKHIRILEKYLSTLRDVKRFLNIFIKDYKPLQRELNFEDYLLLTIIKYKNPETHKKLYQKEYLKDNGHTYSTTISPETEFSDILEILFSANNVLSNIYGEYRRINSVKSFKNYFYNYVDEELQLEFMESIFTQEFSYSKSIIDSWNEDNKEDVKRIYDYICFLRKKESVEFKDINELKQYIQTIFYISVKYKNIQVLNEVLSLINTEKTKRYCSIYDIEYEYYKNFISNILATNIDPSFNHNIIINIIIGLFHNKPEYNIIYTTDELLQIQKKVITKYIQWNPQFGPYHMHLLRTCIKDITPLNTVKLDKEICSIIKELIVQHPEYYISSLVGLTAISSNPTSNSIGCQPHLTEIFGDHETFERFIYDSKLDHVSLIDRVRNFWQLYKSNEYKSIEVENRGNVQTIIDSDLKDLMLDLQQVINIEQEFEVLKKTKTKEKYTDNIGKCKVLIDKIDNIELNIKRARILKNNICDWIAKHKI